MYLKELSSVRLSQRDRIYIVKDLILKLVEYGALNQTALMSFCGLNLKKHRDILEEMEEKGLISRTKMMMHKKAVTIYRPTTKGVVFCKDILEPYEKMFPRSKRP